MVLNKWLYFVCYRKIGFDRTSIQMEKIHFFIYIDRFLNNTIKNHHNFKQHFVKNRHQTMSMTDSYIYGRSRITISETYRRIIINTK